MSKTQTSWCDLKIDHVLKEVQIGALGISEMGTFFWGKLEIAPIVYKNKNCSEHKNGVAIVMSQKIAKALSNLFFRYIQMRAVRSKRREAIYKNSLRLLSRWLKKSSHPAQNCKNNFTLRAKRCKWPTNRPKSWFWQA